MKSIESAPPQQDYMFLLNSQVWKHGLGTIQPGIELSKLDEIIFVESLDSEGGTVKWKSTKIWKALEEHLEIRVTHPNVTDED